MTIHTLTITVAAGEMTYASVSIRCELNGGPDCVNWVPVHDCESAVYAAECARSSEDYSDAEDAWDDIGDDACAGRWWEGEHLHRAPVGSGCHWTDLPGTYGEDMLDLAEEVHLVLPVRLTWNGEDEPATVTPYPAPIRTSAGDA